MKPNRRVLSKSTTRYVAVTALWCSLLAVPTATATVIGYTVGHPLDTAQLAPHGDTVVNFTGGSDNGLSTALAAAGTYDVLMIGESTPLDAPYDPANVTALQNYVSSGGKVVVAGAHQFEDDFLNAVFGFATTNAPAPCCETSTFTLQPGAIGTSFAGGPVTLTDPSFTPPLFNVPGTILYADGARVAAFTAPYGAGTVVFLAWDFCCGTVGALTPWYDVLDNALEFQAVPTPGTLALLAVGMAAGATTRRRAGESCKGPPMPRK